MDGNGDVIFYADGTFERPKGDVNIGEWTCDGPNQYTLRWERSGYIDKVTLSADENQLRGRTNTNSPIGGDRIN